MRFFLTASDTNAGKTFVGCLLAAILREAYTLRVCKPVESGCTRQQGTLIPHDASALQAAAHDSTPLSIICPLRFAAALSPPAAADCHNDTITLDDILTRISPVLTHEGCVLIEGAGGLLSPIAHDASNCDLALACNAAAIIIVPNTLGAVNQAALTYTAAKTRGLPVIGIVLNDTVAKTDTTLSESNYRYIADYCDVPIVRMPHRASVTTAQTAMAILLDVIAVLEQRSAHQ